MKIDHALEALIIKFAHALSPYAPILIGPFLNWFITRQIDKANAEPRKSFVDMFARGVISMLLAIVTLYGVIAFYEFKDLEPKLYVMLFAAMIVGAIGFEGVVWFMREGKSLAVRSLAKFLGVENKEKRDARNRDHPDESR